uniref:Uncharacterized protein n=1 Tax=Knipowitschia caucasica TaxID=637954 RepID=A0AAV2J3M1_KNICA
MDRNEVTTQLLSTTGATLTVYTPKWKKAVYILSSMHNLVQTEDTPKRKPNTVTLYHKVRRGCYGPDDESPFANVIISDNALQTTKLDPHPLSTPGQAGVVYSCEKRKREKWKD